MMFLIISCTVLKLFSVENGTAVDQYGRQYGQHDSAVVFPAKIDMFDVLMVSNILCLIAGLLGEIVKKRVDQVTVPHTFIIMDPKVRLDYQPYVGG